MEALKLKICGMKEPANIRQVAELQPEYMGFIFYKKTPRYFENSIPEISDEIKKTGVFVDATSVYIQEKIKVHGFRAIQLHGNESPDFCKELKKQISEEIEIIKVFSIKNNFDFNKLKPYEAVVDFFLFDTKGKTKGGTGKTFNWEILKDYPSANPFFLSGGIGLEEIDAIKKLQHYFQQNKKENLLYALDVNSRFETEPGIKDIEKLKEFIKRFEGSN